MPPLVHRPTGEKERIALRRAVNMERRAKGMTMGQIRDAWNAEHPDATISLMTVCNDVSASLEDLAKQSKMSSAGVRELLVMRLDAALSSEKFQAQIERGNLLAIDRLIKLVERYAKLYGADAPTKVTQTDLTGETNVSLLSDEERASMIETILGAARLRQLQQESMTIDAPEIEVLQTGDEITPP